MDFLTHQEFEKIYLKGNKDPKDGSLLSKLVWNLKNTFRQRNSASSIDINNPGIAIRESQDYSKEIPDKRHRKLRLFNYKQEEIDYLKYRKF